MFFTYYFSVYSIFIELSTTHDFSRHIYVTKFGAKVLPPVAACVGWQCGAAVCGNQLGVCCLGCQRDFAKFHRAQRKHLHLLVLSQSRICEDTILNGHLYMHVRNN